MDKKELDFLRGEYEFMSLDSLEEMISYGPKQYEPEVFALLEEIVASKKQGDVAEQDNDSQDTEPAQDEDMMAEYIPLVQMQTAQESAEFGAILDEQNIDHYYEPFVAGIVRPNDPHSFLLVNHNDFHKALEILVVAIPEAQIRT